jgi:glycosyltransferase involved in cell wall biosynthesis
MPFNVVVGLPQCSVGGVPTFVVHLARYLNAQRIPTHLVWTCHDRYDSKPLPLPADVPVQKGPWMDQAPRRVRWKALAHYLEELAPCLYLPNDDWWHSCVSAQLSDGVAIVGHIHTDCSMGYEHFAWLGKYWNRTVAVSSLIGEKAAALCPDLAQRLVVIPYGVSFPPTPPERPLAAGEPLQILYSGRLIQEQKRVFDLPKIVAELARRAIPIRLNIAGGGWDEAKLRMACQEFVDQGLIRFCGILSQERLGELYQQNDVFILTSEYEGLPLALLEAMGHGCVPVVTDTPSGVPEVVQNGVNGYLVPVAATQAFADRLAALYHDPNHRRKLAQNAFATVSQGGYRIEDMGARYVDLFRKVWREIDTGAYRRPQGKVQLPPFMGTWKDRLPRPVLALGSRCKRMLRQAHSAAAGLFR